MRKFLRISGIVLGVVVLLGLLALAAAALIPFDPIRPEIRNIPDQKPFKLDEKAGLYLADDGRELMVTWGSYGGLTVNGFHPLAGGDLVPVSADEFIWKPYAVKEEYRVSFARDANGVVAGMRWRDAAGRERSAVRRIDPAYGQAEVRWRNGGVELVGLLLTPSAPGPWPGVVFVHGSGRSIRDYLYYLQTADFLARSGCAVLVPDKRGCGKSGGEWLTSTFADYAQDALAGIDLLAATAGVDPGRVGLIGVSQGGWVLPLAASLSEKVRFIVLSSGSATVLDDTMRYENECNLRDAGVPRWLLPLAAPAIAAQIRRNHGAFWKLNGRFDPLPYWLELRVPALVLNGEKDRNVPVSRSLAVLEEARRRNPGADITVRVFAGSGHGLEEDGQAGIRGDCLQLMVDWIKQNTENK